MSIAAKLLKNSTIKHSAMIENSKVYGKKEEVLTPIPAINVAISGSPREGLKPGLFTIAGKSRHFKSNYALVMGSSFQRAHKEGVILFYDSEFGSPQSYFQSAGIDLARVVHTPITNIEELKFDIMNQLEGIEKGDKVMIIIDSVGNLASKKEVEDAINEKSVSDMTRAKQLKSLWRMVTPHLNLKDICCIAINHVYDTQEMYSQEVVSGGTGGILSSDLIWTIGRQQDVDAKRELKGYNFIINIYKSRHVKEKSKIPINVKFDGGIYRWSGMWEWALGSGHLKQINQQKFVWIDPETGELLSPEAGRKALEKDQYFEPLLENEAFIKYVEDQYKVVHGLLIANNDDEDDILEDDEE